MDVMAGTFGMCTENVNRARAPGKLTDARALTSRAYSTAMDAADILSRIDKRMQALGLNDHAVSVRAKKPDVIRNIRRAVKNGEPYDPRAGTVESLAVVLATTAEWLVHGSGDEEVSRSDVARAALAGATKKKTAVPVAHEGIREIDVRAGMGGGGVPVSEMRQVIGSETYADDAVRGRWSFPDYFLASMGLDPRSTDIVEAEGESMLPDLQPGDRCVVDRRRRSPSPDGIYALWDGFGIVIKALQLIPNSDPVSVRIISKNPAYSTMERTLDEVAIIGKVVNVIRRV